MKSKRVLMIATDGVEQVELLATHDVLIRKGHDVDIAFASENEYITTSFNIKIKVDKRISDVMNFLDDYAALVIPGGPGYAKLDKVPEIDSILKYFGDNNKLIASICAGPTILAKRGYLKNKKAICFNDKPLRKILTSNGAIIENPNCNAGELCDVVMDGNIITGLNMQSSIHFGEEIANYLNKTK